MKTVSKAAIVSAVAVVATTIWADTSQLETARALLATHQYEDAIVAVDRYLDRHPYDPAATIVKSDLYAALGQWDRSVGALESALAKDEENVDLLLALADAYREKLMRSGILSKMSNAKKSRRAIEKAFEVDPADLQTRRQMVMYLVHAPGFAGGDKERAEEIALETVEIDEAEGSYQLAVVYWKRGKTDASTEQFRRTLAFDPGNVDALLMFGQALIETKEYTACENLYLDFIAQWPDRPEAYWGLADCYKERKMADEAIARYLAALDLDGWSGYPRYNVARLYEKKKDKEQAAHHYRILLERNPGYIDIGTAKKQLRKIEKGR